jgi:hypothetical protein
MQRMQRITLAAMVVSAAVVVAVVVLVVLPGLRPASPNCPTDSTVEGHAYCAESVTVEKCTGSCSGALPAPAFVFHGVSFLLNFSGSAGAARLTGTVTEPNSTHFQFTLFGDVLGPPAENWTSPDHGALVAWQTPYATGGNGTALTAFVELGVSYALADGS